MTTPYSSVFRAFLGRIEDDYYAEVENSIAEEDCIDLMNAAIFNFPYCRIDLANKNDVTKMFNVIVGHREIQVLAILMKHEWAKRQIASIEHVRQKYSERDFQITSQASHLKVLIEMEQAVGAESRRALKTYSHTVDNQPSEIFGRLATKGSDVDV